MDGLKRAVLSGDQIAEDGGGELCLRIAELERGVEIDVCGDVTEQDPFIVFVGGMSVIEVFVGVPGARLRGRRIRYGLPAAVILFTLKFQGSGDDGEFSLGTDEIKRLQNLKRFVLPRRFPRQFRKFPGLKLRELGRRIHSLQNGRFPHFHSRVDPFQFQFQLWFSDVGGAARHQLNGNDERDNGGADDEYSRGDLTSAEVEGGKTRQKE